MIPDRIGRYEVRAVAGSGGFATVFEGYDPRLDARVAIKVLADNKSRIPETRRRFRQEAVLLRRMRTEAGVPGLIEVFDIDETEHGQPFFVMGWADRGTLHERRGTEPWTPEAVSAVIRALTQCLGHLHAAGVVHRDIKPHNLLLRAGRNASPAVPGRIVEGEQLLVGDLGLAKNLADNTSAMSLIGGTERYMAPEQLVYGGSVDHRADIFAASLMIQDLLRGPAGEHKLSTAVREVIDRGAAHDRNDRYASMAEWQDQLTAALAQEKTPATTGNAARNAIVDHASAFGQSGQATERPTETGVDEAALSPPRSPSRTRRSLTALGLVALALIGAVAAWALRAPSSPIDGPSVIVSGQRAEYSVADADDVRWIDPRGTSIFDQTLTITGRLPGEVRFSALVDGERFERTVTVEPAPNGPAILGPDQVSVGQTGTYRASVPQGNSFYWIHPTQGRISSTELTVEQLGNEFVVGLVAVDGDGTERGQQLRVTSD